MSHILRQLLILLQLFEEDAVRERKAVSDTGPEDPTYRIVLGQHNNHGSVTCGFCALTVR